MSSFKDLPEYSADKYYYETHIMGSVRNVKFNLSPF